MPTDTLHSTTCASAVALAAPTAASSSYPTARKHNCIYRVATPATVRVTTVADVVPPAPKK